MEELLSTVIRSRLRRFSDSESSSSSDEDWDIALNERGKRKLRPRITGYTQVVDSYEDNEFKSHFRSVGTRFLLYVNTYPIY